MLSNVSFICFRIPKIAPDLCSRSWRTLPPLFTDGGNRAGVSKRIESTLRSVALLEGGVRVEEVARGLHERRDLACRRGAASAVFGFTCMHVSETKLKEKMDDDFHLDGKVT